MQIDLSKAYILKANMFVEASLKIPNSRPSMYKIFKSDASYLRVQADELSNLANSVNSYQAFSRSMATFYRARSTKFAELAKSSRGSFMKDVLLKHSKILSKNSKYWERQ